jgi:cytochrome c-type biogenesis protein CcmH
MRRVAVALFVWFMFALSALPASADGRSAALEKETTALYQGMLSPFCAGRSLNDCPSSKAQELKDEMRARLEAGESKDVILEDVIARYGEQYRAVPLFAGFGVFVWIVPIGFVLVGLTVAVLVSSGRRKGEQVRAGVDHSSVSDDMTKKLQDELAKLD